MKNKKLIVLNFCFFCLVRIKCEIPSLKQLLIIFLFSPENLNYLNLNKKIEQFNQLPNDLKAYIIEHFYERTVPAYDLVRSYPLSGVSKLELAPTDNIIAAIKYSFFSSPDRTSIHLKTLPSFKSVKNDLLYNKHALFKFNQHWSVNEPFFVIAQKHTMNAELFNFLKNEKSVFFPHTIESIDFGVLKNKIACYADEGSLYIMDLNTQKVKTFSHKYHGSTVIKFAFNDDYIFKISSSHRTYVYNLINNTYEKFNNERHTCIDAHDNLLALGTISGQVEVSEFSWKNGFALRKTNNKIIYSVQFSKESPYILGTDNNAVYIWNLNTQQLIQTINNSGHQSPAACITKNADTLVISEPYVITLYEKIKQNYEQIFFEKALYNAEKKHAINLDDNQEEREFFLNHTLFNSFGDRKAYLLKKIKNLV